MTALLCALITLLLCAGLGAQTFSHLLSFQGRLCGTDGTPLPDGAYSVRFTIYDAETEGSSLWQETQNVNQVGGIFSTHLGTVTAFPSDLFSGADRWVGIKVGDDPEMAERVQLTPGPWAIYASESDKVDGFNASDTPTPEYLLPLDEEGMFPSNVIPPDDDWTLSGGDIYRLTGNVGIGKSSPAYELDVDGTAQMTGFRMPTGASDGYVLTSDGSGVGTWAAPAVGGSGTANYIPKWTGASTLADSVLYEKADGKVGVGTTGPNYKLDVSGDIHSTGTLRADGGDISGNADAVLTVTNTYTTGMPKAIYGLASPNSGQTRGVWGQTNSTGEYAAGVLGLANASSGKTMGVYGTTKSSTAGACGVYGATSSGATYGVKGYTSSTTNGNAAVYGDADGGGVCYGVYGETGSWTNGAAAVYGWATSATGATYGVYGETSSSSGYGVYGKAPSGGIAVYSAGPMRSTGQITSTVAGGTAPLSVASTTVCTNLNADLLDGNHSGSFGQRTVFYVAGGGGSTFVSFPHYYAFQITIGEASGSPSDNAVGFVHCVENDGTVAWLGYNGDGTQAKGRASLGGVTTILSLRGGNITLQTPGDGTLRLKLTSASEDVRGLLIW